MLQTVKAIVLCGCSLLMFASCKPGNKQIAKSVTSAATAIAPNVTATVKEGIVTLNGMVPDNTVKSTLDSMVKKLNGVVSVVDSTSIESPSPAATSNSLVAPPPPPPPSATPLSPSYTDSVMTKTINTTFKSNQISGVKANVVNSVITLTGNTDQKDLKKIMTIAHKFPPEKVVNKLTVK